MSTIHHHHKAQKASPAPKPAAAPPTPAASSTAQPAAPTSSQLAMTQAMEQMQQNGLAGQLAQLGFPAGQIQGLLAQIDGQPTTTAPNSVTSGQDAFDYNVWLAQTQSQYQAMNTMEEVALAQVYPSANSWGSWNAASAWR